jgi:hypothetical protein
VEKEQIRKIVLQTLRASLELQLRGVKELLDEEGPEPQGPRRTGRRRQSLVDLSLDILTENQRPMHVNELVDRLRLKYGRITDRDAISSALGKKAHQGVLFRQTAPATFEAMSELKDE